MFHYLLRRHFAIRKSVHVCKRVQFLVIFETFKFLIHKAIIFICVILVCGEINITCFWK